VQKPGCPVYDMGIKEASFLIVMCCRAVYLREHDPHPVYNKNPEQATDLDRNHFKYVGNLSDIYLAVIR